MKYSLTLIFIFALLGAIHSEAEEALPPQFNFDRYAKMVDHSPFAVATEVAAPAATPDFAKDLYIANAARSAEGDMVTIASTSDHNFKKYLTTREPVDGYSIANIEWSDKVGATKVTISKDGNFATITFNQALLSQPAPNAGVASRAFTPPTPAPLVTNPASVPNPVSSTLPSSPKLPSSSKLPSGVPAELQQLMPSRETSGARSRGLIPRNPGASPKTPYQRQPSKN
jgi:hypothetical protein